MIVVILAIWTVALPDIVVSWFKGYRDSAIKGFTVATLLSGSLMLIELMPPPGQF